MAKYSSKLIENVTEAFASLPGIGKKTALRLALHIAQKDKQKGIQIAGSITQMIEHVKHCNTCYNLSDTEICAICADDRRNAKVICVVESIRDVIAIEETGQYNGQYHVLGGVINPLDGIGPEKLQIESLVQRISNNQTEELIMALRPSIEGDTTIYYISKKIQHLPVKLSLIARGISFGGDLEYVDEITLARSIQARTHYHSN